MTSCNRLSLLLCLALATFLIINAAITCKQSMHLMKADAKHVASDVKLLATKRQEWDAWFNGLRDPIDTGSTPTNRTRNNILYYHVMKTGGTTLYGLFDAINQKNGMPDNPGTTPRKYGVESPGYLSQFISWRMADNMDPAQDEKRLLAISFREPVERVISHYFQLKPCPDGNGGGHHKLCRASAEKGFSTYLKLCTNFVSNFQSRYLNGHLSRVNAFDFLILNDRSEESLVLASIRFGIPIRDMLYVNNGKARVGTADLVQEKKQEPKSLSCTAQWIKKLVPQDKLEEVEACVHSCAGKIGRLIFTKEELEEIEARNKQDIDLWRNHILPKYNADKAKVLEEYGVTQEGLDKVVQEYRDARTRYQAYVCEEQAAKTAQGSVKDGCKHLKRRKLLEVAEWLQ